MITAKLTFVFSNHSPSDTSQLRHRSSTALGISAVVFALAASTQAEVEVMNIGEPTFNVSDIAFGFARGTQSFFNEDSYRGVSETWKSDALGSGYVRPADPERFVYLPVTPHDGPYDQEVRRSFAAHGLFQTDVMTASEMRGPNFLVRGYSLLPDGNTLGNSPDGSGVPVIPSDLYPMQTKSRTLRNGERWPFDGEHSESPKDLSQEGVIVDEHGSERDFTGLNWSHQVRVGTSGWGPGISNDAIVGDWEQRTEILDAGGENGWEIVYRWEVVNRRSRLDGDLSHNDELDLHDLDILIQNVAVDATNLKLDLNGDDTVTFDDVHFWVSELKNTWTGDANLDGKFNSGDFVDVFSAGKYESGELARWSEGDWNADERFNSSDLVFAFQGGGYDMGARPVAAAVPEPLSGLLLIFGFVFVAQVRRSCR